MVPGMGVFHQNIAILPILAPSPKQEMLCCHGAMVYNEAIVKYHQPRIKFNFPEGMPIEDQSDDDDGFGRKCSVLRCSVRWSSNE